MSSITKTLTPPKKLYVLTGTTLLAFLSLTHLVSDAITNTFSALLPTLQVRFGLSETILALLVATLSFSASVTQPFFGALADRLGQRQVAALGVILNAVLLSLIGIVPSVFLLFGLLLVGGFGSAALHPAGASLARETVKGKSELSVSLFSAGGTFGVALGPVIVLILVSSFGLKFTPWLMVPAVFLGLLMFFAAPSDQQPASAKKQARLIDLRLLAGPVGLLSLAGILSSVSFVTFSNAISLWLVKAHSLAHDDTLIGWTLAAFALSAAFGGILAGLMSRIISQRFLISGTMLLALLPLFVLFTLEPGTLLFFLTVVAAGGLLHASLPLMIVNAQDLAPQSASAASGMLMGFAGGMAGLLYVGIGRLQELIGLEPAMKLSFLTLIPAAVLAFYVITKYRKILESANQKPLMVLSCLCSPGLNANINACPCRESNQDDSTIPVNVL